MFIKLNNLKLFQKLGIAILIVLVPMVLTFTVLFVERVSMILDAKKELIGAEYGLRIIRAVITPNPVTLKALKEFEASHPKLARIPIRVIDLEGRNLYSRITSASASLESVNRTSGLMLESDAKIYTISQIYLTDFPQLMQIAGFLNQYFEGQSDAQSGIAASQIFIATNRINSLNKLSALLSLNDSDQEVNRVSNSYKKLHQTIETIMSKKDMDSSNSQIYMNELIRGSSEFSEKMSGYLINQIQRKIADEYAYLALYLVFLLSSVLLGFFVMYYIQKSVIKPVKEVTTTMSDLSVGQETKKIEPSLRKDEIGALITAMSRLQQMLVERRNLLDAREIQAEKEKRIDRINQLNDEFRSDSHLLVQIFVSASEQLTSTSGSLSQMADGTHELTHVAASATDQIAVSVDSIVAATKELESALEVIGSQVDAAEIESLDAVTATSSSIILINELSIAADRIGAIVGLINSIASQTNLLALNATIEAARAGESGRGFAIVAGEVKSLAAQTARATDEIATQVASMQEATKNVVATINNITDKIQKMAKDTHEIKQTVSQEKGLTRNISDSVQQVVKDSRTVAKTVSSVKESAVHTSGAASELQSSADDMQIRASNLRDKIDTYLTNICAA
ncbi:MAG: HAMP domain-containing methyl-accepting chemotaxis protein [Candidatus Pacebacteria bacterium]|nr:HAMP domain-containing methyl-accepting chemotaxis protein [Candidatus Paceibacterota bacterium]